MNASIGHPAGFSSVNFSSSLTQFGVFLLGGIVGISIMGVVRIGEAETERAGSYTATPALSMPDNVTASTPNPFIPAVRGDTDSPFYDYRLERDACCPGE
jgi:hypothetical protein